MHVTFADLGRVNFLSVTAYNFTYCLSEKRTEENGGPEPAQRPETSANSLQSGELKYFFIKKVSKNECRQGLILVGNSSWETTSVLTKQNTRGIGDCCLYSRFLVLV